MYNAFWQHALFVRGQLFSVKTFDRSPNGCQVIGEGAETIFGCLPCRRYLSPRVSPSRAPVFSCAHYFQAPATQAINFQVFFCLLYRFYLKLHFHKFQSIANYWGKCLSDQTRKTTFKVIEKYRYGLWKLYQNTLIPLSENECCKEKREIWFWLHTTVASVERAKSYSTIREKIIPAFLWIKAVTHDWKWQNQLICFKLFTQTLTSFYWKGLLCNILNMCFFK